MSHLMHKDVERVLFTPETLQQRVRQLGQDITRDFAGKELLAVGILKGAVVFYADLLRQIDLPVQMDFMACSSYGAGTQTTGTVRINKDLDHDIAGRHVLLVEDILDTGLTLSYLKRLLEGRKPASITICALLDKAERRVCDIAADYVGFSIPDAFVVGYGLDYDSRYRNLPYVGVLKPQIYGGS
jgi:hypoxanthine phosphoribosyltransferase